MNAEFRKPQFTVGAMVIQHQLAKDSVLVCLYSNSQKLAASLEVSARWEADDRTALKVLITEFSKLVHDGLSEIQAKLLGPKTALDELESLFKRSSIRIVGRRDTDIEQSSQALFYGPSGRLRVAFSC